MYRKFEIENFELKKACWMEGRMGGWMDGWVDGKAGLRIAYSNQKLVSCGYIQGSVTRPTL